MKKTINLSLGEKTINQLKEISTELDMSISACVTMLTQNYVKEQNAMEMLNNQNLIKTIQDLLKQEKDNQQND